MRSHITGMLKTLDGMETTQLTGGFESSLTSKLTIETNGEVCFKSVELQSETERTSRTRQQKRTFEIVRKNSLRALRKFLVERFQIDEPLFEKIEPFINFNKTANIEEVHSLVCPDLQLASLSLQFQEISDNHDIVKDLSLNEILVKLAKTTESRKSYWELIVALARISASTPHSADVERCI